MSDIMRPMSIGHLMNWALSEYKKKGSIFGIDKLVHYTSGQALPIYEEKIESPFGPAAGPNTQLAQNIIASYVAGSRFFELKTVQVMDGAELSACVAKPCITAGDECYNCEWSTELYVSQAYAEYVKAWVVCKILAKELGLGNPDGFVFNMSVGYDLEGIKSEKVNTFIDDMIEAKDTEVFKECINWALENVDSFENVDADYIKSISSNISSSITESTLHGCPPDEIERIATYLITEKHLHTFIKCNPTLLGYEYFPVHEELGYSTITFGQIQGGYQPYVVPDACTIFIDCRLAPPITDQIIVQHFNKIIKEIETQIPGIKISYDITGNRPYIEKNPDSILLKNLKEAVEAETKQKAVVKAFTGYTDTAVIAGRLHNTECMSYGPGSLQYAHKPDEFVEIRDIIRCEKVMNHLVMSLCEER